MTHQNEARIRAALDAYRGGSRDDLREHLSDDIVWHVGGDHPLSGDYRGIDAVLDYHDKTRALTGGTLALEPLSILADDDHAGIFMRVQGEGGGAKLDTVLAEALRLDEQGRWVEYWAQADDQAAVDSFWRALA
jgi:ketosteroid isomerase-like protein